MVPGGRRVFGASSDRMCCLKRCAKRAWDGSKGQARHAFGENVGHFSLAKLNSGFSWSFDGLDSLMCATTNEPGSGLRGVRTQKTLLCSGKWPRPEARGLTLIFVPSTQEVALPSHVYRGTSSLKGPAGSHVDPFGRMCC